MPFVRKGRSAARMHVAHQWAHGITGKYKKDTHAPGLFFSGDTIYSYGYHFPIAAIHQKNKRAKKVVLFTLRDYSQSTSAHKSEVQSAVSHLEKIYCYDPKSASNGYHSENLEYWENRASEHVESLAKARRPGKYYGAIAALRSELQKYCKYFGITKGNNSILKSFTAIWTNPTKKELEIIAEHEKKDAVTRERQIAAAKERSLLWQAQYDERRREENRLKQIKNEAITNNADKLNEAWLNGDDYLVLGYEGEPEHGTDTYKHVKIFGGNVRLRVKDGNIETTKNVEIPIPVAQRFYSWLQRMRSTGGCNGDCKHKILDYEVSRVDSEGFEVGCHNIEWSEAERIAKQLNW